MYDPLTAQRIHPHACSYIPHLSNPSRGEVLLIQHQFLEHPYFVQTETQSRSIKLTPIYNLAFTLDNNSYLMHMQLTHQANKYIQAIFSFWPIQVYPALYTTYGMPNSKCLSVNMVAGSRPKVWYFNGRPPKWELSVPLWEHIGSVRPVRLLPLCPRYRGDCGGNRLEVSTAEYSSRILNQKNTSPCSYGLDNIHWIYQRFDEMIKGVVCVAVLGWRKNCGECATTFPSNPSIL